MPKAPGLQCILTAAVLLLTSYALCAQNQTGEASPLSDTTSILKNSFSEKAPHLYRMNYWFSVPFCLVATAADVYAIPSIIKSKKDLTDAELLGVNKNAFNGFDSWVFDQDLGQRDDYYQSSDYVLPAIVASAAFLGLDKKVQKDWARLLLMYYEMHAVTFSFYNFSFLGPAFQNKLRPIVYYDQLSLDDRRAGNNRNSMYSGHTASAVASTFFMVKVYSDYHPEIGGKKYLLYVLASVPPLVEGYLRVKALAHFPSDVMVGFVVGAACGITIPALHKLHSKTLSVGLIPTPAGPGLSLNWHPYYENRQAAR